jgi:uncharacterized protein (TIGR02145 family)
VVIGSQVWMAENLNIGTYFYCVIKATVHVCEDFLFAARSFACTLDNMGVDEQAPQ